MDSVINHTRCDDCCQLLPLATLETGIAREVAGDCRCGKLSSSMSSLQQRGKSYRLIVLCTVLLIAGLTWFKTRQAGDRRALQPRVGIEFLDYSQDGAGNRVGRFRVTNEDSVVIERINSYRFQIPRERPVGDLSLAGENISKVPYPTKTPKTLKPREEMLLEVPIVTNAPSWRIQLHYATGVSPKPVAPSLLMRMFPMNRRGYYPVQSDWIHER